MVDESQSFFVGRQNGFDNRSLVGNRAGNGGGVLADGRPGGGDRQGQAAVGGNGVRFGGGWAFEHGL